MRLCYGELTEAELAKRERIRELGRDAWQLLTGGDPLTARAAFERIDERLSFELVAEDAGRAACAELSALEASAWPLVELLLAEAPTDLGCALSAGRAPRTLTQALAELESGPDLTRASLRAGFSRGHLLEITLGIPGGTGAEIEQIAAENLVRALLGDRLFDTWIGRVHVTPAPRGGPLRVLSAPSSRDELGVNELCDTVHAAVLGVLSGLPDRVWSTHDLTRLEASNEHGDWTMLEVEPLPDARGLDKDDLLLASTCTPELLRCYLDGSPCSSRRFSRSGERFVFVSYPDTEPDSKRRLARRSELELELGRRLVGVGAVTGVGLGLRTTYLDLALCNLGAGLPRLVSELRDLGAPELGIIRFFDSELSEEWVSISPSSVR